MLTHTTTQLIRREEAGEETQRPEKKSVNKKKEETEDYFEVWETRVYTFEERFRFFCIKRKLLTLFISTPFRPVVVLFTHRSFYIFFS